MSTTNTGAKITQAYRDHAGRSILRFSGPAPYAQHLRRRAGWNAAHRREAARGVPLESLRPGDHIPWRGAVVRVTRAAHPHTTACGTSMAIRVVNVRTGERVVIAGDGWGRVPLIPAWTIGA